MADRELEILRDALREHIKALTVDIGPRTPSTPHSLVRAANYIHSVFEDAGLIVREQDYDYYDQRVTNLLATAPAAAGASAYYVIGAHYDTVPSTPGADDNASAVAVLLELARRLRPAKLKAPVLFAAFTLEEPPAYLTGHQGSRIFVRNCQRNGDRVLGAIILEMVGYTSPRQHYPFLPRWPGYPGQGNFIGIIGNWRSLRFGRSVLRGFRKNNNLAVESLFLPFDGWILPETRLSDHASFWDAGLPALMVTDTAFFRNPNYHLPSDTIDTLDFRFMSELVKSLEPDSVHYDREVRIEAIEVPDIGGKCACSEQTTRAARAPARPDQIMNMSPGFADLSAAVAFELLVNTASNTNIGESWPRS